MAKSLLNKINITFEGTEKSLEEAQSAGKGFLFVLMFLDKILVLKGILCY